MTALESSPLLSEQRIRNRLIEWLEMLVTVRGWSSHLDVGLLAVAESRL